MISMVPAIASSARSLTGYCQTIADTIHTLGAADTAGLFHEGAGEVRADA